MLKMQPRKSGMFALLLMTLLAGCGGGAEQAGLTAGQGNPAAPEAPDTGATDFRQTGFVLTRDVRLHAMDSREPVDLGAGTELAILERRADAEGELLRVGLDAEEGQVNDFWVRASELPESDLLPYAPADTTDDTDAEEEDAKWGDLAKRRMTYCYRYVKQYLLQTGKVKTYLPGGSAWMAASILPKYGFRRTGVGPAGSINGDVCVYSGGNGGHGHIEVKRNGLWWYGYGFRPPISTRNHRLLGCFRK